MYSVDEAFATVVESQVVAGRVVRQTRKDYPGVLPCWAADLIQQELEFEGLPFERVEALGKITIFTPNGYRYEIVAA